MKILDTDILSLFFHGHPRVVERYKQEGDEVAITIVSRIQVLQGRFAMFDLAVSNLAIIPKVLPIDDQVASKFDGLRQNRKLRKIGRADLLIGAIALAKRSTLVTRNLRDFRQFRACASRTGLIKRTGIHGCWHSWPRMRLLAWCVRFRRDSRSGMTRTRGSRWPMKQ